MNEFSDGILLAVIALREGKCERQIRLLLPLAFVSPSVLIGVMGNRHPQAGLNLANAIAA